MPKKMLLFDFDETLASLTDLHRLSWRQTLNDVNITDDLKLLLPAQKYRMERFDSAMRISQYFFKNKAHEINLKDFFRTDDRLVITNRLLELKESHLLYSINQLGYSESIQRLISNFIFAFDILSKEYDFGIISSTRQSIIYSFLSKVGLVDTFKFVIGEEQLWRDNHLHDKPSAYALTQIPERYRTNTSCIYIGDDVRIDSLFAYNAEIPFIQMSAKDDLMYLIPLLKEIT